MSENGLGKPTDDSSAENNNCSHECPDCGKGYQSNQGVRYHLLTDENDCSGIECPECGDTHFFNQTSLSRHMTDAHGLERSYIDPRLSDESWFRQKYLHEGYSTADIAEICDCSTPSAQEWKRKHGLDSVTDYKSRGSGKDNPTWKDNTVETDCASCGKSMEIPAHRYEKADNNFCGRDCMNEWVSHNRVGENHPLYKGGPMNYGPGWHSAREDRLEHDNHKCQRCGDTENLEVHHIRPVRDFEEPRDAHYRENLITLCRDCHTAWEGIPLRPQ